MVGKISKCFEK